MTKEGKNVLTLDTPAAEEATTTAVSEQVKSALAELVGEGKKFANEEELAKAKNESDAFIDHIKGENKELRDTLAQLQEQLQATKTESELEKLRHELSQSKSGEAPKEVTPSQLVTEDLDSMIEKHITAREIKASAQANLDQVNEALVAHFGDPEKAAEAVRAKASELGLSVEDVTAMAAKSPTAAMALVKGEQTAAQPDISKQSSTSGVATSEGISQMSVKAEFDKLRREDPTKYYSPAVQNKIFELHKEGKYEI